MLSYNEFLPYFSYYRYLNTPEFSWWFCILDENIYETEELYEKFGYTSICDICDSGNFIQLYKVDIVEIKKELLRKYCPKNEILKIEDDREFDVAFNIFIETSSLLDDWFDYEQKNLKSTFAKWCADNHIKIH